LPNGRWIELRISLQHYRFAVLDVYSLFFNPGRQRKMAFDHAKIPKSVPRGLKPTLI
jgi:hypothetical protein